jgi:hypothetical protein
LLLLRLCRGPTSTPRKMIVEDACTNL